MPVTALGSLPDEMALDIGKNCGRRVLPYRMQDRYSREREVRDFQSIVLENENLKATFLPELGGRLISFFHKPTQRELLFKNSIFQPANLALRDAWFAGGIEWNIGQFGHAFHTCSPVFAAAINGLDGSQGLRIYDFDRCKGLLWQIDFHLPSGAKFLHAFTRVVNPNDDDVPMYWWTNVAIVESEGMRVLAPAQQSIFVDYRNGGLSYGQTALPGMPPIHGQDGTYPANINLTCEFFYQCQDVALPWQAALDGEGSGFVECSTHPLNVRKLFSWGTHQGGTHWQNFLSDSGKPYIEIQAGLAPTQQHTVQMPGHSQWQWTQAFGYLEADSGKVHHSDWLEAWQAVDTSLKQSVSDQSLREAECADLADAAPIEMLHHASGWGALEAKRLQAAGETGFPSAFLFPESTMGEEQQKWLDLLEKGTFPDPVPQHEPGEWMIQAEWTEMLEKSLFQWGIPNSFALLHLGVMKFEHGDEDGAVAAWEESVSIGPSSWGWRNLAVAAIRRGEKDQGLHLYQSAWDCAVANGNPDVSFAFEYLTELYNAGEQQKAWAFYQTLSEDFQLKDSMHLMAAKVAFALGNYSFVETALERSFASIREGARDLTDLWFGIQGKKIEVEKGVPYEEAIQIARKKRVPPVHLDFRIEETSNSLVS
ncbi:DUF5107 domain-containing protein [Verrucomicrobiaceae bacterium N1E253]|uniref:DUF5107 domain-containing protein n=2 Tax=Oceaniferula marina TaxID=2748318 RepID=A0A851GSS6_9BACT|nr:DUF5107 domain-containing protein [Oceaniferula marina]